MIKSNKHIEIVRSSTPRLSSMGQKSCDMIVELLGRHYEKVGVTTVNTLADLDSLVAARPDLAFLSVKRLPIDNRTVATNWVSAYLDEHHINYSGSSAAAIALDFNKPDAKQAVAAAGLRTSAFFSARPGQYLQTADLPLPFPLFIKPPNGGGGQGIAADSVVRDFTGFTTKVQSIADEFHSDALVETYLPGREFSVAILQNLCTDTLSTMPIELIAERNSQGDRILGQAIKAADTEAVIAVPDLRLRAKLCNLASEVFKVLGGRDYGRIDIRLDENGEPHFLEANLIPGLALHRFTSYFTSACQINQSLDYETMILNIVELGIARQSESFVTSIQTQLPRLLSLPLAV